MTLLGLVVLLAMFFGTGYFVGRADQLRRLGKRPASPIGDPPTGFGPRITARVAPGVQLRRGDLVVIDGKGEARPARVVDTTMTEPPKGGAA
jgi:hypothetical protein